MADCKPISTPMIAKPHASPDGALFPDPHFYRSIVGSLQYLTSTRPDISFSVNYVCQFMHNPTAHHFQLVKRILRYLKGTLDVGIRILSDSQLDLYAFSDFDWGGCPLTHRSTTGFCTFLGNNPISWSAKKQPIVARSSAEAKYRALSSTATELTWLSFILCDIGVHLSRPPTLFCDNISTLHLTVNLVFHARTKHIEIDYHFVREKVALGSLITRFIPSAHQVADVFTKPLSRSSFSSLCVKLGLWSSPQPSLRGNIKSYNDSSKSSQDSSKTQAKTHANQDQVTDHD